MTYYNEFDPKAAAWLRELIAEGLIPAGEVDERSITDVKPHELTRFTQQHFFCGIGGWPLALRLAGWPDDQPVRTGSCPCQPFSQAGQQKGEADARHVWPFFRDLISFGEPTVTFGEQVASALGRQWLAGIRADLEGLGYAVGAADLCAAGLHAPHIRQRLYWVADASGPRTGRNPGTALGAQTKMCGAGNPNGMHGSDAPLPSGAVCGLPNGGRQRWSGRQGAEKGSIHDRQNAGRQQGDNGPISLLQAGICRIGNAPMQQLERLRQPGQIDGRTSETGGSGAGSGLGDADITGFIPRGETTPTMGYGDPADAADFWADSQWIRCRDGKHRRIPTEPALFPLADGLPYKLAPRGSVRPALLKGSGNAIVPQVAAIFIQAFLTA